MRPCVGNICVYNLYVYNLYVHHVHTCAHLIHTLYTAYTHLVHTLYTLVHTLYTPCTHRTHTDTAARGIREQIHHVSDVLHLMAAGVHDNQQLTGVLQGGWSVLYER